MQKELLMVDSSTSDGHAETVMDYIISYTLRSATQSQMPEFRKAARAILFNLLEAKDMGQKIINVKVWKQWRRIDLTVEVIISHNGQNEKHVVLIEDKYYTAPHDNQLSRYKKVFDDFYKNDGFIKHYALITAIYRDDSRGDFNRCYGEVESLGYKVYSMCELLAENQKETESDIFNQFWLADWH